MFLTGASINHNDFCARAGGGGGRPLCRALSHIRRPEHEGPQVGHEESARQRRAPEQPVQLPLQRTLPRRHGPKERAEVRPEQRGGRGERGHGGGRRGPRHREGEGRGTGLARLLSVPRRPVLPPALTAVACGDGCGDTPSSHSPPALPESPSLPLSLVGRQLQWPSCIAQRFTTAWSPVPLMPAVCPPPPPGSGPLPPCVTFRRVALRGPG